MAVLVGTSGWHYDEWRGGLYPAALPVSAWLSHYGRAFQIVEANSAFYRLPSRETFERWAAATPADFVFALKASRFLTHLRRLADPAAPVARLLEHASGLGAKLGPVLLQLPPTLRGDPILLDEALSCFPPTQKVAVEPRHESWYTERVAEVLEARGAALCLADRPGWQAPRWQTAPWGYVRLHEGRATPPPCYGRRALASLARHLAETWSPTAALYVFFNNDPHGCAVRDARVFANLARKAGLEASRVPPAGAAHLTRLPRSSPGEVHAGARPPR